VVHAAQPLRNSQMLAPGDKVKVLTAKNFNSAILQSDVPAVGTATRSCDETHTTHL
jgi:hypothetical protein